MEYVVHGFVEALRIITSLDVGFAEVVWVSILVSLASTTIATITGVSFGIAVAQGSFRGKHAVVTVLNTLMSIPTVVVGLMVYSFLSRKGPLGDLGLLFTPTAMVVGQAILAFPIIAGFTVTAIGGLDKRIRSTALALGADRRQGFSVFLREARFGLLAAVMAGFGRVFAEVGVSMMLGGNIEGYTRNITTAIALETSKGEFAMGVALGIVLLSVALCVNVVLTGLQRKAR